MKAAFGDVTGVRDYPSLGVTRITVEIPHEFHVAATDLLHGQKVLVTVAPEAVLRSKVPFGVIDPGEPMPEPAARTGQGTTQMAGIACKEPAFQRWLRAHHAKAYEEHFQDCHDHTETAARLVRMICRVQSRADLDRDPVGASRFFEHLWKPYMEYAGNV